MDIKKQELKKVLSNPILIVLAVVFQLYNGLIIYENSYIREDVKLANRLIDKFGYEVNDEMLKSLDEEYTSKTKELNKIIKDRFNKEFSSVSAFLNSDEYKSLLYSSESYLQSEVDLFDELLTIGNYKNVAIDLIDAYEDLDIMEMAQGGIEAYGIGGDAANLVRKNYEKLIPRFNELKNNGEHKNLFFIGTIYKTHSLLFKKIFVKVIFEIIILIILAVSLLVNYERDNKTIALVSSTKRGRELIKDKLFICIVSAIIITALILGITLLVYFTVFDYSKVYKVPISSALNWELQPVISWFNVTFIEYLLMCIAVVFIASIIFASITFVICSVLKSSYKTFFVFFIIFGIVFMLPAFTGNYSKLLIWCHFNVFNLILNPNLWFREAGPFFTYKGYEFWVLSTSGLVTSLLTILCIKRFKKESIV